MSPPPPRREHRTKHWKCAELAPHAQRSEPGSPRIRHTTALFSCRLRQAGGDSVRSPPSTCDLPIVLDPLPAGRALPWDAAMSPSLRDSRGYGPRDGKESTLRAASSGQVPFACARNDRFPPERAPTFRAPAPRGALPHCLSSHSSEEVRPSELRFRTVPFPTAFPATPPKRCDLPSCGSGRCASRRPSDRFPGGIRPSVHRLQAGAFRLRPE